MPHTTDIAVSNSVMNSHWGATSGNYNWLNFSIGQNTKNGQGKTAQDRVYGVSGWQTLARAISEDPRDSARVALTKRTYYPELAAVAPVSTTLPSIELTTVPTTTTRSSLNPVWVAPSAASMKQSGTRYRAIVASKEGSDISYPEPLLIVASPFGEQRIAKAGVQATVRGPDDAATPLTLHDDGVAPDALADDGFYTAIASYGAGGEHAVTVVFDNVAGTAEYTDFGVAPSIGPDGETYTSVPYPVGEGFLVTGTLTVTVHNYMPDDHGDTPATATLLFPDNVDVAGRVDRAEDVDVFQVVAPVSETLCLRVSSLALDMQPVARLYGADGATLLGEYSLEPDDTGYLYAMIDPSVGVPFYVQVSHQDPAAVTGLYNISVGAPLAGSGEGVIPPTLVELAGLPTSPMSIGINYTFHANVQSDETSTPLTYLWCVTDLEPVTREAGLSDSLMLNWSTPGTKIVTVTATNPRGTVTATQTVKVYPEPIAYVPGSQPWIANYGRGAGGWSDFNIFPRHAADVNGDGRADIVGFGNKAVYVSLNTGGAFAAPRSWISAYGPASGGWTNFEIFPRFLADVNGDGKADIVAFGNKATYVSLSTGSSFAAPKVWIAAYGPAAGGWTSFDLFPRMLADVNGDGKADIVAFGNKATYVSLSTGTRFLPPVAWISSYGPGAGGWSSYDTFPRMLTDVNGDGKADIVGFGNKATYVSYSTGTRFTAPAPWAVGLGPQAGGWMTQDGQTRLVGDVNGDGKADIVAFGQNQTYAWRSTTRVLGAFSWRWRCAEGWTSQNLYPRTLADVNGDGKLDVVGFAYDGTFVQLSP